MLCYAAQDPWGPEDRPEGLEESWWARLLEHRDTRIDLERRCGGAWARLTLLAAQLDSFEREDAEMGEWLGIVGTPSSVIQTRNTVTVHLSLLHWAVVAGVW